MHVVHVHVSPPPPPPTHTHTHTHINFCMTFFLTAPLADVHVHNYCQAINTMAVASSQVGQVFTGPLFSIYVGVATIFNDHSWSKGPHFICPPDHSTTVCYRLEYVSKVYNYSQESGQEVGEAAVYAWTSPSLISEYPVIYVYTTSHAVL